MADISVEWKYLFTYRTADKVFTLSSYLSSAGFGRTSFLCLHIRLPLLMSFGFPCFFLLRIVVEETWEKSQTIQCNLQYFQIVFVISSEIRQTLLLIRDGLHLIFCLELTQSSNQLWFYKSEIPTNGCYSATAWFNTWDNPSWLGRS